MSTGRRVSFLLIHSLTLLTLLSSAGCSFRLSRAGHDKAPTRPAPGSPADAKALSHAAYKQIGQGNYEAAVQLSRQAVALDPTLAEAQKNLAVALCDHGNCEEALAPAAVRLRPDFDKAHYVLGKVFLGLGRYQ